MGGWVYVFTVLTVILAMVGAYLTMVGFVIRDPHTLVAASMLMVSSVFTASTALMIKQFNGKSRDCRANAYQQSPGDEGCGLS